MLKPAESRSQASLAQPIRPDVNTNPNAFGGNG
jgi:hypothetical protein